MHNLQTTRSPGSPPEWLRDTVDVMILAAALLAMTLAAVF
jgi:hypothetical protein